MTNKIIENELKFYKDTCNSLGYEEDPFCPLHKFFILTKLKSTPYTEGTIKLAGWYSQDDRDIAMRTCLEMNINK